MNTKKRVLLKHLSLQPYFVELWVLIADNPAPEVTKLCLANPGLAIRWTGDMAAWTEDKLYKDAILPVIFDASHYDTDTAVHEAVHIKNILFKECGVKHDFENDEPEAYFMGWLVGELEKIYKEFKSK